MTNRGQKYPAVWYAHSRCSPCLPWYRAPCQLKEFFRLVLKVNGHYQWDILLHYVNKCWLLSNTSQMTNFFSAGQHTSTSCMQHSKLQESEFSTSLLLIMVFNLKAQQWRLLIMIFRDSHISMSISYNKSTRLKKSSSDWLKSHEVGYSIRLKRCDFCVFLFHKIVQRHYLGEVGK